MSDDTTARRPPRDNLYRASYPAVELERDDDVGDAGDDDRGDGGAATAGTPKLNGHFAVFDQWTEINSAWEGSFLERVAPGAFRKTMRENRDNMLVLFQHGRDPQIGDKPLGPILDLREDDIGAYYSVRLLPTSYNADLIPGLDAGLYGASFRFRVMREDYVEEPPASSYNPKGMPERTIKEAQVMEFGPVSFPAYTGASAELASGCMRSITDIVRDVDQIAGAAPILLDEQRLNSARAFISDLPYRVDTSTTTAVRSEDDTPDDSEPAAAPPPADAAPERAHLSTGRRGSTPQPPPWWRRPRDERRTPWDV